MLKKIILISIVLISFNQILLCNNQTHSPSRITQATNLLRTCPTRTRAAGNSCQKYFDKCHDLCEKHPEASLLTIAGAGVLTLVLPTAATLGFAAGLICGIPIYNKYCTTSDAIKPNKFAPE
jgi:hypothetical protein